MKNVALAVVLLVVAGISYESGRRHGSRQAATTDRALTQRKNTETVPVSKPHITRESNRVEDLGFKTLNRDAPFAQNMTSAERGFEAARINLDDALEQIASLPVAERMGFTTGIFSFVARNHTPADALKVYQRV